MDDYIKSLYDRFPKLDGFILLTLDNIEELKGGDHIQYFHDDKLIYGGKFIRLKDYNYKIKNPFLESLSEPINNDVSKIKLFVKTFDKWRYIPFSYKYIFFKPPVTKSDELRSILEKHLE